MKLSKEELKKKIADSIEDNDLAISLLEDIEDSFIEGDGDSELEKALESAKAEIEDLKKKYKERFLNGDDKPEETEETEETEELEEKEVIDIKEI